MRNLLNTLLAFFDKKEKFLVVELFSHGSRVSSLTVDAANKKAYLDRLVVSESVSMREALSKFRRLPQYKIMVSLPPKLATTVYSGVSILRDRPRDPIDEADLDNLLSQAVWKFFDRYRATAAKKMGAVDIDVLLTDVRVSQIRLDGHRVVNPIGFKAGTIEVQMNQTFTTRAAMHELKEALPIANIVLITESGTAGLHVLSRIHKEEDLVMASIFPGETDFFSSNNGRLAYHDQLAWGSDQLGRVLERELAVSAPMARAIMAAAGRGQVSSAVAKKIENILLDELQELVRGLSSAMKKEHRLVYLNAFFDLPPVAFSNSLKRKFDGVVRLGKAGLECISENYQFGLECKESVGQYNLFSIAALLVEHTMLPNDGLSKIARKRVRWLSPV